MFKLSTCQNDLNTTSCYLQNINLQIYLLNKSYFKKYSPKRYLINVNIFIEQQISQQMDSKMHRYMQRIEKIMGTPNRNASPLRPSRSPLASHTNQLDKYIKFQLSGKIINSIIKKKNYAIVNTFFSRLRNCEYRQRQRVYKFVAIEKKDEHLHIDTSISGKIMAAVLKQLLKKRRSWGFSAIKNETKAQSSINNSEAEKKVSVDNDKPFKLMRSLTKPQKQTQKNEVMEWVQDASTLAQKQILIDKINQLKRYTLKAMLKFVSNKSRKNLEEVLKKISMYSLSKYLTASSTSKQDSNKLYINILEYDQQINNPRATLSPFKNNKNQAEAATSKFSKSTHLQSLSTSAMRNQTKISKFQQEQMVNQTPSSSHLYHVALRLHIKNKSSFLSQVKGLISSMHSIHKTKTQIIRKSQSLLILDKFFYRRLLTVLFLIQHKSSKSLELQKSKIHLFAESKVSKVNSSRLVSSQAQNYNSIAKLNFYSFVDKIFKVILIISKLLIPMKEAFVKIDKYASFSFRVEQSLKIVPTKIKITAFEQMKRYADAKRLSNSQNISRSLSKGHQKN